MNKPISPKLVANYFPRRFLPLMCAANPYTFWLRHEKEAKVEIVKCGFWLKLPLLPLLWYAIAADEN